MKGTAWWNEEVKAAIEKKMKAIQEWLSRKENDNLEEGKGGVCAIKRTKRAVSERKHQVDEEFGDTV